MHQVEVPHHDAVFSSSVRCRWGDRGEGKEGEDEGVTVESVRTPQVRQCASMSVGG